MFGTPFMLFGVIVFHPPLVGQVGHYVSAIKLHNTFVVYDDMASSTYNLSADVESTIHALFYVRNEQTVTK